MNTSRTESPSRMIAFVMGRKAMAEIKRHAEGLATGAGCANAAS